jgi:hypothetical protein
MLASAVAVTACDTYNSDLNSSADIVTSPASNPVDMTVEVDPKSLSTRKYTVN